MSVAATPGSGSTTTQGAVAATAHKPRAPERQRVLGNVLASVALLRIQLQHEWMLQSRSFRFRFGLLVYIAFAVLGPVALILTESRVETTLSPATGLAGAFQLLPFVTILFTLVVVGNTTRLEGLEAILVSAPMSNSGFLLRKLASQLTIVVVASLFATAAAMAAVSWQHFSEIPLQQGMGLWLVMLVPRIVIAGAGWLGAVLILRSEVAAFFAATVGLQFAESLLNHLLFRTGIVLSEFNWTQFRQMTSWAQVQASRMSGDGQDLIFVPASETRVPLGIAWQQSFTSMLLPAAAATLVLGLGVGYLNRCRADVPPTKLGHLHPLRTFALRLRKLRDSLRPDSGLTRVDRGARILLTLIALGLLSYSFSRGLHWQELLAQKNSTLMTEMATTSLDVRPLQWTAKGRVDRSGKVTLSTSASLVNQGATPVASLSFELDRHLALSSLESQDHTVTYQRSWDRLVINLEPVLEQGDEVVLLFETQGYPSEDSPRLRAMLDEAPAQAWTRHINARFPRERSPLLHSFVRREVSAERTLLRSSSLFPTPRFTSWAFYSNPEYSSEQPKDTLEEAHAPTVEVVLDLIVPSGWVLSDSCGNINEPGSDQLRAVCNQDLNSFSVVGGERVLSQGKQGRIRFATLQGHEHLATESMLTMERVLELATKVAELSLPKLSLPKADGQLQGAPGTTITAMEMPSAFELGRPALSWNGNQLDASTRGQLIVVPESRLMLPEPIPAPELVAQVLLYKLRPAAQMPAADERAFLALYRTLMLSRMGENTSSAAVTLQPWYAHRLRQPLLDASVFDWVIWQEKAPAVLADLEARVGRQQLLDGFRSFLVGEGQSSPLEMATMEEKQGQASLRDVFAAIERRSGVSLEQFYQDFFVGLALPQLRLKDVQMTQDLGRYIVTGALENTQTGVARCKISVKTDQETFSQTIEVGTRSATPFEFVTGERPFTVMLDPDLECYRFRPLNHQDSMSLGDQTL